MRRFVARHSIDQSLAERRERDLFLYLSSLWLLDLTSNTAMRIFRVPVLLQETDWNVNHALRRVRGGLVVGKF